MAIETLVNSHNFGFNNENNKKFIKVDLNERKTLSPIKNEFLSKKRKPDYLKYDSNKTKEKINDLNKSKKKDYIVIGSDTKTIIESGNKRIKIERESDEERKDRERRITEIMHKDPKYNLILKYAHKIKEPQSFNELKKLIPLESIPILEKGFGHERKFLF
jgi:hypothetical protein